LELFESFPCLIKGLALNLEDGSDVIPKLGRLTWWKIFAKKHLRYGLLSGEKVGVRVEKP